MFLRPAENVRSQLELDPANHLAVNWRLLVRLEKKQDTDLPMNFDHLMTNEFDNVMQEL